MPPVFFAGAKSMYKDNCCLIAFARALVSEADMLISPLPVVNDGAWIHRLSQVIRILGIDQRHLGV